MAHNIWAVPLRLSNFNIALDLLGGFISLFGLVSFLLKEDCYLSESLISLLVGLAFGPRGANLIRPRDYLVLAGVQLPRRYLVAECKSLLLLVGPGMTCMWLATSLLVWVVVGTPSFLHALAVGACVTPTDPVLSAVIVKGRFADQNIPTDLQDLVVAESGTNDGLGYPFLFLALYLIKYAGAGSTSGGMGDALSLWFALTWRYVILLSVVYGAAVGLVGRELLHWAERRNYVDGESFVVFSAALALFVLGTCGLVGTDDVLACFVAGNTFTWDDWFRMRTRDDSLQPTMDMLLNVTIFLWYGAALPWRNLATNTVPQLSIGRLVVLAVLVLILRRLPWVFGMRRWIHQIQQARQAIFVGFFGPMGVSAVFYLHVSFDFIHEHLADNGGPRSDVEHLGETIRVVVWFLVVSSIVVHGLSVPLGKVGCLAPRALGRVLREAAPASVRVPVLSRWLGRKDGGAAYSTVADAHPDSPTSDAWEAAAESSFPEAPSVG